MSKLSIVISGTIEKSNFDEWKTDLVEKIRSVNTELKTDDDFVAAGKHVKQFKAAEKSLKEAKKSALEQAAEINNLFDAIDTVSEEARQARLKLDKQIKKRKKEIKQDFVAQGVESIKAFIADQSSAFHSLSHTDYTDEEIFADALSGKASTKGMQKAITKTCESIKEAITKKAADADANSKTLDKLPTHHKALFQDRGQLLALDADELNKTIDERIDTFKKQTAEVDTPPTAAAVDQSDDNDAEKVPVKSKVADKADYTITIEINATQKQADAIRTTVVEALSSKSAVGNITLNAI